MGEEEERLAQIKEMHTGKYNIILTTYDVLKIEIKEFLKV